MSQGFPREIVHVHTRGDWSTRLCRFNCQWERSLSKARLQALGELIHSTARLAWCVLQPSMCSLKLVITASQIPGFRNYGITSVNAFIAATSAPSKATSHFRAGGAQR